MFTIKIFNPPSYEDEPDYLGDKDVVKTFSYKDWPSFRRGWRRNIKNYEGFYYAALHEKDIIVCGVYDYFDSEYLDDYRASGFKADLDYVDHFGNEGEGRAARHDLG